MDATFIIYIIYIKGFDVMFLIHQRDDGMDAESIIRGGDGCVMDT
jgi:hypothetical protein